MSKKVLIIGLDGCRPDCLRRAKTPNISKLLEVSAFSMEAKNSPITWSAPNWATVITGVWEDKHGVRDNDNIIPEPSFPHLFALAKKSNPHFQSVAIVAWDGFEKLCLVDGPDDFHFYEADEEAARQATHYLNKDKCPDLLFLHLDGVDHAGHHYGYGSHIEEYMQAIQKTDLLVGMVLDVVAERKKQGENWLIILTTDHGGSLYDDYLQKKEGEDRGYHGADIPEQREVFIIASSPGIIGGEITPAPSLVDIVPTVISYLELAPQCSFDGSPLSMSPMPNVSSKRKFEGTDRAKSQSVFRVLQFTDLHHFGDQSVQDADGISMMASVATSVKPDLVVLSGDIIDGRYIKNYVEAFSHVVEPFVKRNIPWAYTPGNHDDESKLFTRKDLQSVLKLPYCAHSGSFDSDVALGPLHIYLIDSNAYVDNNPDRPIYDFIHKEQIEWFMSVPRKGEVAVCFYHIPIPEYKNPKILVGKKGEEPSTPLMNSGFFEAAKQKGIAGMFVGHDHLNDYIADKDGIWLGYGRCSGYTPPTYYCDHHTKINHSLAQGGRVIEYNSETKELSSWIHTLQGISRKSFIKKTVNCTNLN